VDGEMFFCASNAHLSMHDSQQIGLYWTIQSMTTIYCETAINFHFSPKVNGYRRSRSETPIANFILNQFSDVLSSQMIELVPASGLLKWMRICA
jgi:hypothetical protein